MQERRYHHGDLRNALIAEGLAMLDDEGLPALSLRALAARVGESHAAPKNHFGNLRGLLTAVAAEGFRRHAEMMRAGLTADATREQRLAAAIEGYVAFAARHPHLFTLMFSQDRCNFADPELAAAAAESYGVLREIATGLDWDRADEPEGQLRSEMMLWSFVHGYAQLARNGMFRQDAAGNPVLPVRAIMPRFRYRESAPAGTPP